MKMPLQPPPLECQYCGADMAVTHHKLRCRVVGWAEAPTCLSGAIPESWQSSRAAGESPAILWNKTGP